MRTHLAGGLINVGRRHEALSDLDVAVDALDLEVTRGETWYGAAEGCGKPRPCA